jgi:hypothetical protein
MGFELAAAFTAVSANSSSSYDANSPSHSSPDYVPTSTLFRDQPLRPLILAITQLGCNVTDFVSTNGDILPVQLFNSQMT